MRHAIVAVLGALVLVALVMLPAPWHAPIAAAAFAAAWLFDREVARGLGRPGRWLIAMLILVLLGAWLGPHDPPARWLGGVRFSRAGALAGLTMASRAIGLLCLTSALTRAIRPERLLARLAGTRAQPLAASVVVALRIAPELAGEVRGHVADVRAKLPGVMRAPARWFEVLVLSVARATALADEVSRELVLDEGKTKRSER